MVCVVEFAIVDGNHIQPELELILMASPRETVGDWMLGGDWGCQATVCSAEN